MSKLRWKPFFYCSMVSVPMVTGAIIAAQTFYPGQEPYNVLAWVIFLLATASAIYFAFMPFIVLTKSVQEIRAFFGFTDSPPRQ